MNYSEAQSTYIDFCPCNFLIWLSVFLVGSTRNHKRFIFNVNFVFRKLSIHKLRSSFCRIWITGNPDQLKGCLKFFISNWISSYQGLRTPGEEIAFTARPNINSQSQIFRYGQSIFCLPHRPKFSDIFDLCLHWVSEVQSFNHGSLE